MPPRKTPAAADADAEPRRSSRIQAQPKAAEEPKPKAAPKPKSSRGTKRKADDDGEEPAAKKVCLPPFVVLLGADWRAGEAR
jgi:hypothetical protein